MWQSIVLIFDDLLPNSFAEEKIDLSDLLITFHAFSFHSILAFSVFPCK